MADLIKLLPDAIANQIAAGEVVQRPASVVKELIENAVDAGADSVKLIVKDSGKALIQVIDDGCGMSPTDARMSFERHATSKIRGSSDLFSIRTMGFRGEALASIAAVAQVELRTRRATDELGSRLLVEASEVKTQEACQCPVGSNFSVRNLFYNVPARRNFLKSNAVEMRHILDEFQRVALAYPDVGFSLHHNNEEVMRLPEGNLRQRIVGVLGQNYNKRLVPVEESTDIVKINGFVGKPEFAKKTRGEQYLFVNQRFIKSAYLHHAVVSAFEELLPKETFPLYVLFLDLDPAHIDVNVHPTKQEIKFDDERLVYNYVRVAVRHALGKHNVTPSLDFDQENTFATPPPVSLRPDYTVNTYPSAMNRERQPSAAMGGGEPSAGSSAHQGAPAEEKRRAERNLRHWEKLYEGLGRPSGAQLDAGMEFSPDAPAEGALTLRSSWDEAETKGKDEAIAGGSPGSAHMSEGGVSQARDPYQLHHTYIVSQIKSGFMLIDQQAAHERVLYERYVQALSQNQALTQQQLFARTLTLSPADAVLLEEMLPQLRTLGFDIEGFGQNAFIINGLPADVAGKKDEMKLIEQLLEQYRSNLELKLDGGESLARAMARSNALKRGQALTTAEMRALIDQLFACASPYRSPMGRQCFITFELDELNRRFDG